MPGAPTNHEPVDDLTQDAAQRAGWGCFWHFFKSTLRILWRPYTDSGFLSGAKKALCVRVTMMRFVHVRFGLLGCGEAVTSDQVGPEATVAAQISRATIVVGAS